MSAWTTFPRTLCKAMLASMTDDPTAAEHPAGKPGGPPANRWVTRLRGMVLRALAHPIRLSLVGLLRVEGPGPPRPGRRNCSARARPACPSTCASWPSTAWSRRPCGGKGRECPWRATAMFTNLPDVAENPDLAVAAELLSSVIAERYFEDVMRWLEVRQSEPEEWQRVAQLGDTYLYITPDELATLGEQTAADDGSVHRPADLPGAPARGRPPGQLPAPGLPAAAAVRPSSRRPARRERPAAGGETATLPEEAPPDGSAR